MTSPQVWQTLQKKHAGGRGVQGVDHTVKAGGSLIEKVVSSGRTHMGSLINPQSPCICSSNSNYGGSDRAVRGNAPLDNTLSSMHPAPSHLQPRQHTQLWTSGLKNIVTWGLSLFTCCLPSPSFLLFQVSLLHHSVPSALYSFPS